MTPELLASAPQGCRVLEWDSEFFGIMIANIEPQALVADAGALTAWCNANVDCTYLLVDTADQAAIAKAQELGFRLVDVRVTLERRGGSPDPPGDQRRGGSSDPPGDQRRGGSLDPPVTIRAHRESDLDALKRIARVSHRDTRFYVDGRFDRARCDEMYDVWITKSCNGWADHVLVAEVGGSAAGYLTCHRRADYGEVGLVGVAAERRGAGVGASLTAAALEWFRANGIARVSVVTQGRNAAGLRLYQRAGFAVRTLQLSYHKWR